MAKIIINNILKKEKLGLALSHFEQIQFLLA
jgi:hypothetical protein